MPALDGVRILDMTQYEAGTSCTQALAWLGADVVKVEPPSGDPGRAFRGGEAGDAPYFINWNSNKRSIAIDLSTPEGRDLLLSMAPHYDAFVENYGPDRMEKLGIDYEVMRGVNPAHRLRPGEGLRPVRSVEGLQVLRPHRAGGGGGLLRRGGGGRSADVARHDHGRRGHRPDDGALDPGGLHPGPAHRGGATDRGLHAGGDDLFHAARASPGGATGGRPSWGAGTTLPARTMALYPCAPGGANDWVTLIAVTSKHWDALVATIDRPELLTDPRFSDPIARMESTATELYEIIAGWTRQRTKWQAMEALSAAGRALQRRAGHGGTARQPAPARAGVHPHAGSSAPRRDQAAGLGAAHVEERRAAATRAAAQRARRRGAGGPTWDWTRRGCGRCVRRASLARGAGAMEALA